jgi:4-amino-4-deoxy-L-arabinose transferase-like glycosyltransferase
LFKKAVIIVYLVLMVTLALFSITMHDLHPDEAHYWVWAQNLDYSYYDNAPMVACVIRLFTAIFGKNQLAMRLPAWLGYCFMIGLAYFFGKRVYSDQRTGIIAAILGASIPIYQGAIIITSDVTNVLFSALTVVFAYFAIEENKKINWLWAGMFFGLALLSKYQAVLLGGSIFLMLLLRKDKRCFLSKPFPYIAALISIAIFAQVLIWNYHHDWLSFRFQLQHGLGSHSPLKLAHLLTYITSQAITFSPLLFLTFLYYLGKFFTNSKLRTHQNRYLLFCSLPVFLFFGVTSLKNIADLQWTIVAVFPAIIFIAGQIGNSYQESNAFHKELWFGYLSAAILIAFLLVSFVRYPEFYIERLHVKLAPNAILTNRIYGWSAMGKYTDRIIEREFSSMNVPVFVTRYQLGGVVAYYDKTHRITVLAAPLQRRNQFDEYTLKRVMKFDGRDGLLISNSPVNPGLTPQYFQTAKLVGEYRRIRFNHLLESYYYYKVFRIKGREILFGIKKKPLF